MGMGRSSWLAIIFVGTMLATSVWRPVQRDADGRALPRSWDADAGVITLARHGGLVTRLEVEKMLHAPVTRYSSCPPEGSICERFTYPDGSVVWVQFKDAAYGWVSEWGPNGESPSDIDVH